MLSPAAHSRVIGLLLAEQTSIMQNLCGATAKNSKISSKIYKTTAVLRIIIIFHAYKLMSTIGNMQSGLYCGNGLRTMQTFCLDLCKFVIYTCRLAFVAGSLQFSARLMSLACCLSSRRSLRCVCAMCIIN